MTHELKTIVQAYRSAKEKSLKSVLATVVALEGSSYRRPGVRMLILENGKMVGAVSGGCVEKEVLRQAETVFKAGVPKMMTYDGRYRLGCEGILYILIEPFNPEQDFIDAFWKTIDERKSFKMVSFFSKNEGSDDGFGSIFQFKETELPLRPDFHPKSNLEILSKRMDPCLKLMIFGAEHDAVQLCSYAAMTGWEVTVVASPTEEKNIRDFPGAKELLAIVPDDLSTDHIDEQTAIMVMTHSYVKDLQFLLALKDTSPIYLGLLGPSARREKLLNEFMERCPEVSDTFFDRIHGPAGLNIGAESPQEIAISIISEILSVVRSQDPILLKNKKGTIHS